MNSLITYDSKFRAYNEKYKQVKCNNQIGGRNKKFKLHSSIKGNISDLYTTYGKNFTPTVTWSGVPKNTKELLLMMYDTDANNFLHWLVYDIDPKANTLEGNYVVGTNEFGNNAYNGPEPDVNTPVHHYKLVLYALKDNISLDKNREYTVKELKRIVNPLKIERVKIGGDYEKRESEFKIISKAISGNIDKKYTKYGDNEIPDVEWKGVPDGTEELLLLMYDPDARNFVHWFLYHINKDSQLVDHKYTVGQNSFPKEKDEGLINNEGYDGPKPPSGEHHYILKLYALKTGINVTDRNEPYTYDEIQKLINDAGIIETVETEGKYKAPETK
jgi:Raf kinase inhibitor-like YbhB/YbcL family protein